ncbi:response regulator [Caulobacter sp. BP25]|uniref:response regulator n=1 Tax=Caulobacter sp. BP25 TaxID=2048900 RepID=UPI000C12ACC7|nr:response regulator [Caulobacter sp. BP25]PHY21372.1 hybrid sensor histidine kinase/response regulator [Caulobacter sp. BP25]
MGVELREFWGRLAVDYRAAAISRRQQVPLRIFVAVSLCLIGLTLHGMPFLAPWVLVYGAAQLLELYAIRSFLDAPAPQRRVWLNLTVDFLMGVVFGALAIPFWQAGTPVTSAGAILLLSGSVFTALMGAEGCLVAFLCAVAPHLAYLVVTPFVVGASIDPFLPHFLIGVGLFCLTVSLTFLWSRRTLLAERAARRAAEAQTAAKSAFIAMVSHELRTPINAIVNGAASLDAASEADRSAAALIADAGLMMRAQLNDLLDLSKIEAGRMGVEVVDHDLRALISNTVRFWRNTARAKGLRLVLRGAAASPQWVRGDPMRVRQILNNLISNAIKFTADGEVMVTVTPLTRDGRRFVSIEVCDTGPGLTEAQIARLFSPYEQLGLKTTRAFGGTGLGLAISRDLARLMGGDLKAADGGGSGACFTLTLPAPEGAPPPAIDAAEAAALATSRRALSVLVVDDHDINRRTLARMLEAFGAEVETAEDALSALAAAEELTFDAILMDVRMPGMDGLEASRRLRESGANRETPIIAVTGAASPVEIAACREAGMTGWVEKPVMPRDLYVALFGDGGETP